MSYKHLSLVQLQDGGHIECPWCNGTKYLPTGIRCRSCKENEMSKITDAINYLQSKVNSTHYAKIMKVLNQQQNQ